MPSTTRLPATRPLMNGRWPARWSSGERSPCRYDVATPLSQVTRFAHESEERFARILDFYGVQWEYEPVEFALEWGPDGLPDLRLPT